MKRLKLIKVIASSLIVVSMLGLNSIGANAEWRQNSNGWWNTEGSSWSVGWKEINGEWYYFDKNGYMATGWIKDTDGKWYFLGVNGNMKTGWLDENSKWYYLGPDGALKVGWMQDTDGSSYFADASGVMQTGIMQIEGKTYAFGENGALKKNESVVFEGKTYSIDENGIIILDGNLLPDNKRLTKDGKVLQSGQASNSGTGTIGTKTIDTSNSSSNSSLNNNHSSSTSSSSTTINIKDIIGVKAPVAGETPVSTISDTKEYKSTIAWSENPATFEENKVYTATITILPKPRYKLNGVPANFFTVDGATTTNDVNSGVIKAVFPATGSISSVTTSSAATLEISLEGNPASTGYEWEYNINPDSIIKEVSNSFELVNPDKEISGSPGIYTWKFSGLKEGSTEIIFRYCRSWEEEPIKTKTYICTVDKYLNITAREK